MSGHRFTLTLAIVLILYVPWMESRYLPTRGDNTKIEEIKSILSELLDKVSGHESSRQLNYEKRFVLKRAKPSLAERFLEDYASPQ